MGWNYTIVVRTSCANRREPARGSGAKEPAEADRGADDADHDADAEDDQRDVGGVARGDEELAEEAVGGR